MTFFIAHIHRIVMNSIFSLKSLFAGLGMWFFVSCGPAISDTDKIFGRIIYIDSCQTYKKYLFEVDIIISHNKRFSYYNTDTLTIDGEKYKHVVQIDTGYNKLISDFDINQKIALDVKNLGKNKLLYCVSTSNKNLTTVSIDLAYKTSY